MIISSELTGKTYKTVDECLAAEKEFVEKKEKEEKARAAHKEAVDKAYKEAIEACEKYMKLVGMKYEPKKNGYRLTIFDEDELEDFFDRVAKAVKF